MGVRLGHDGIINIPNLILQTRNFENICGIDVSGIEKSMPIYQREATKCLCGALVSGLVYLLADKLEKELEK